MKKFIALLLTGALAVSALTGCGSKEESAAPSAEVQEETKDEAEEAEAPAEEKGTITVASSATPHA